jgi:hypothetical protein
VCAQPLVCTKVRFCSLPPIKNETPFAAKNKTAVNWAGKHFWGGRFSGGSRNTEPGSEVMVPVDRSPSRDPQPAIGPRTAERQAIITRFRSRKGEGREPGSPGRRKAPAHGSREERLMGRPRKYQTAAERAAAYRRRLVLQAERERQAQAVFAGRLQRLKTAAAAWPDVGQKTPIWPLATLPSAPNTGGRSPPTSSPAWASHCWPPPTPRADHSAAVPGRPGGGRSRLHRPKKSYPGVDRFALLERTLPMTERGH